MKYILLIFFVFVSQQSMSGSKLDEYIGCFAKVPIDCRGSTNGAWPCDGKSFDYLKINRVNGLYVIESSILFKNGHTCSLEGDLILNEEGDGFYFSQDNWETKNKDVSINFKNGFINLIRLNNRQDYCGTRSDLNANKVSFDVKLRKQNNKLCANM